MVDADANVGAVSMKFRSIRTFIYTFELKRINKPTNEPLIYAMRIIVYHVPLNVQMRILIILSFFECNSNFVK